MCVVWPRRMLRPMIPVSPSNRMLQTSWPVTITGGSRRRAPLVEGEIGIHVGIEEGERSRADRRRDGHSDAADERETWMLAQHPAAELEVERRRNVVASDDVAQDLVHEL